MKYKYISMLLVFFLTNIVQEACVDERNQPDSRDEPFQGYYNLFVSNLLRNREYKVLLTILEPELSYKKPLIERNRVLGLLSLVYHNLGIFGKNLALFSNIPAVKDYTENPEQLIKIEEQKKIKPLMFSKSREKAIHLLKTVISNKKVRLLDTPGVEILNTDYISSLVHATEVLNIEKSFIMDIIYTLMQFAKTSEERSLCIMYYWNSFSNSG